MLDHQYFEGVRRVSYLISVFCTQQCLKWTFKNLPPKEYFELHLSIITRWHLNITTACKHPRKRRMSVIIPPNHMILLLVGAHISGGNQWYDQCQWGSCLSGTFKAIPEVQRSKQIAPSRFQRSHAATLGRHRKWGLCLQIRRHPLADPSVPCWSSSETHPGRWVILILISKFLANELSSWAYQVEWAHIA